MAKYRVTKKEILSTLCTYDVTKICALYKRIFGSVPMEERIPCLGEKSYKCLDSFQVWRWVKQYPTSAKMEKRLYNLLINASHYKAYSSYEEFYAHTTHSVFAPLPRHAAHLFFQKQVERGADGYSKVAMMGETYLYACSPVFGHKDYNKSRMLLRKGNERFCEILINKYGQI